MTKVPTILKYGFLFSLILCLGSCVSMNPKDRALVGAIQDNDPEATKELLNEGASLDFISEGRKQFFFNSAVIENNFKMAKIFVDNGANVNSVDYEGVSPIFWAALHGDIDMVGMLIRSGAYVDVKDSKGNTPLHWAALGGSKGLERKYASSLGRIRGKL
jgi:ankyrin repeat protein